MFWPDVELTFTRENGEVSGYRVPYHVVAESARRYRFRPPPTPFTPVRIATEDRKRYLGWYELVGGSEAFRVQESDSGELTVEWGFMIESLVYGGGHLFKIADRESFYFFNMDRDGEVLGATMRWEDGTVATARRSVSLD